MGIEITPTLLLSCQLCVLAGVMFTVRGQDIVFTSVRSNGA